MKLSTLRALSDYFNTVLDYWATDEVTDPNAWKANGFVVNTEEMGHIQKYRLLDQYGQEAVDGVLEVESRRCEVARVAQKEQHVDIESEDEIAPHIVYIFPGYSVSMSAGTGQPAGDEYPENYRLIKEPPRGASFIAPINGNSMEPTFHSGDLVFVHSAEEIPVGSIGAFFMDGQQWIKELGNGELISHNPEYTPRPFTSDIRCQGLVLGVCDESYFE